jgi:ribonuclease D
MHQAQAGRRGSSRAADDAQDEAVSFLTASCAGRSHSLGPVGCLPARFPPFLVFEDEETPLAIHHHEGDLPGNVKFEGSVAIDTETMGLNPFRDALCVVQLSDGRGDAHIVRLKRPDYDCPNLKALVSNPKILKIFHFARFDLGMIQQWLGAPCFPVYCTKIASRLARTYTDRHSLKEIARELLGIDMSKAQQSSDWGAPQLSEAQLSYAAFDVVYLHELKAKLDAMLAREGRTELAQACFDFLPVRAALDLSGWADQDIFAHS